MSADFVYSERETLVNDTVKAYQARGRRAACVVGLSFGTCAQTGGRASACA
jgi:hypothetical protein